MSEATIFAAALDLIDPAERAVYLVKVCAGDERLRRRVEALLKVHSEPDDILDAPPPGMPTADYPGISEGPGTMIGPYKLLQQIGEGGMGVVFMAEQQQPVKRRVALKIIKPGMDTRQVIARFEAERQALSMMDHPNIARVLDAGTTSSGRPYFVMELVKGQPITHYCDEHQLAPRQRLELLLPVCQAIQHAHQKGIIHRDIKPSNILVAEYDHLPVPKVIDFGVAKAIHQPLTDKTMFTGLGHVVGTLEYMSPEQAKVNQLDIDTRSDIYSLGVLLYELLTGSTPFDKKRLRNAAWDEMLRIIREEDPPKPSTRLTDSIDSLPSISAHRHMEPAKLTRMVRGELDWIVMKALDKDRNRRYETANGFAMDLQRYLADEAVTACPPSAGYRFRKFVSRNKRTVLAASLIVLSLLAGIAGTAWQAFRAENARQEEARQRELAETSAAAEKAAKLDADTRRQEAERNLTFAKKGNDILGSVFAGLNPKADYTTVAELRNALRDNLAKAVKELDCSSISDPLALASMQHTLGVSLLGLGETDLSIEVFIKALAIRKERLGPDHPDTLSSMGYLAKGYQTDGQFDKALPLLDKTLTLRKAVLGPDHPDTLTSMNNLAAGYGDIGQFDKALPLLEETLKSNQAKLGLNHPNTLNSMNNLALGFKDVGQLDKALPLFEETLTLMKVNLGPNHPNTLNSMNNLATGYQNARQLDRALPLLEETLKFRKATLGPDHPDTFITMNNLALCYKDVGQLEKALPLFEATLKHMKAKLGSDHPNTLMSMNNLATSYGDTGQFIKALPLLEETLMLRKTKLGPDHPDTLDSMNNLAMGHKDARQLDKALPLFEETLKLRKTKLGLDHPNTLDSMHNLAACYWSLKRLDKSIPLFEEVLPLQEKKLGRQHHNTQRTVANLGVNYKDVGRLKEAIPLLEEAHRTSKKRPAFRWVGQPLLDTYTMAGETAKFTNLLKEYLDEIRKTLPKDSPDLAVQLAGYGLRLLEQKQWTEAEPVLRECMGIRQKHQPDVWTTFNTQSMLGGVLLGQKKYTEAEPMLLKGYEGMKTREKAIPPQGQIRLSEAIDRLIQFYTETNKPDELKKWQTKKERRTLPVDKK